MSTWVDLGDLYVKKAGDTVSGSILMANNNLSVAYDSDTTYNVGTEIKSLRDSVSSISTNLDGIYVTAENPASDSYIVAQASRAGVWVGANFISRSFKSNDAICELIMHGGTFSNTTNYLARGCFANHQSGIRVHFDKDSGIVLRLEQDTTLNTGDTMSLFIPLAWN